jgi:hypothetical protein
MKMKKLLIISMSTLVLTVTPNANAFTLQEWGDLGSYFESVVKPNMNYTHNNVGTTYKTHQPPSIVQAREAKRYLNLSEAVNSKEGTFRDWKRVQDISYDSGFHAAVFTQGNRAVVSFRGSELGSSDWITNGIMVQDNVPVQYQQAISETLALKEQYADYKLYYTGHSLGGGLATAAAVLTGDKAIVFDASGLADAVLEVIKDNLEAQGDRESWLNNAKNITNFNLEGELVSDGDYQQDADTLGPTSRQYGDIFYLSDARFNLLHFFGLSADFQLTRHFTTPLKEELQFLSEPVYRNDPSAKLLIDNDINPYKAIWYWDETPDDLDILDWSIKYAFNSIDSILQDLGFRK